MESGELAAALRLASRYGPFFTVHPLADEVGSTTTGPADLRPVLDLADPSTARRRVDAARTVLRAGLPPTSTPGRDPLSDRNRLSDRDPLSDRVVGSTVLLGLAARLFSPWFGLAVATGLDLALTPADLWWQDVPGSAIPLFYRPSGAPVLPGTVDGLADALVDQVVIGLLCPLVDCFAETFRISRRVLIGNLSSSVAGAALALTRSRPAHSPRAVELAAAVLERAPLDGTVQPAGPDARTWTIRRRSCCLRYRIPGAGTCDDCILTPAR